MALNTYHWRHVCFAVNTSRPSRLQSGAKDKEMVMRWFSFTPTLAAMPLIAALAVNGFPEPAQADTGMPDEARAVVAFWRGAGPALWFAKNDAFDKRFRDRFLAAHEAAARGEDGGMEPVDRISHRGKIGAADEGLMTTPASSRLLSNRPEPQCRPGRQR